MVKKSKSTQKWNKYKCRYERKKKKKKKKKKKETKKKKKKKKKKNETTCKEIFIQNLGICACGWDKYLNNYMKNI